MIRSIQYPKTENLYRRDEDTHKLIVGELRDPAVRQIGAWHVTEKIDGTNIRVVYKPDVDYMDDEPRVEVRGRSDRATVPRDLVDTVLAMFPASKLEAQFDEFLGPENIRNGASVTIFGEGYGPGIQKGGGKYRADKSFRMFDVMYHWPQGMVDDDITATYAMSWRDSWCQPSTVTQIAEELGVPQAPVLMLGATIADCLAWVRNAPGSSVALADQGTVAAAKGFEPEGIIARTDPYLYTERGSRVMFKLKGEDLP